MKFELATRRTGEVTILDLTGRMRAGTEIVNFRKALAQLVKERHVNIVVNLKNVGRVDSSGLGELIAGYTTLQKGGGNMVLLNLNDSIVELMMMTKLLTIFEVYEDEYEAVSSFDVERPRAAAPAV